MEEYKKNTVKAANMYLIVFAAISALYYAFSAFMLYTSAAAGSRIYNYGSVINLLMAVFIYLYYKTLAEPFDKGLKRRLIPLSFIPFTVYYLIGSVITSLIGAFPFVRVVPAFVEHKNTLVNACIAVASLIISAAVTVPIQKRLTVKYIDIFFPVGNIVFSKQYGIKRKWYFAIAANLIVSAAFSVITTGIAIISNVELKTALSGIVGAVQTLALVFVTYLLFNAAFKNIDKSYRALFYPFMAVDYIVGKISTVLYAPFSFLTDFSSFDYSGDMDSLISLIPKLAIMLAFGVAVLAMSAVVMIKLLREFEEK